MPTNQKLTNKELLAKFIEENLDFRSASAIVRYGKAKFEKDFAPLLDEGEAAQIFQEANRVSTQTALIWANIKDTVASPYTGNTLISSIPSSFFDKQASIPDYERLFGAITLRECDHCKSIFGPAAYFVDLMRFIDENITRNQSDALLKLENRQPSLFHIDLDCDNTYTLLPFIDIVNEILEAVVRDATWSDAYEKAAQATYPMDLPFHLPHAEVRAYLEAMGTQLYKVYEAFDLISNPEGQPGNGPLSQEDHIGREILQLSPLEFELVSTAATNDHQLLSFFGTELKTTLAEAIEKELSYVETFLERTGLTRKQLMELVYQDLDEKEIHANLSRFFFINNVGDHLPPLSVTIDHSDPANLVERLSHLSRKKLDAIRRFLLLARKLDWSFTDLDWALRSTQDSNQAERVLKFDGINDFVACNDKKGKITLAAGNKFTIEGWVQPEGKGNRVILCSGNAAEGKALLVLMVDYAGRLCLLSPENSKAKKKEEERLIYGDQVLPLGEFSHIAVTLDQSAKKVSFYINGQLDVTRTIDSYHFPTTSKIFDTDIYIGSSFNEQFFEGVITDLRIWKGIRTAQNIDSQRFSRLSGKEPDLEAYWPLSPTPWNNLPDLTTNRNDGVPGGSEFVTQPRWVERDLILDPPIGGTTPLVPLTPEGLTSPNWDFWKEDRLALVDFSTHDTVRNHPHLRRGATTLNKRTVQVWFKAQDTYVDHQVIYQEGENGGGLNIYLHDGFLYFGAYTDNDAWEGTFLKTSHVYANQWHHAAIVLEATNTVGQESLRAYVDGRLVDTGPAKRIETYNGKVELGGVSNSARFHDGKYLAAEAPVFRTHTFKGMILEFQLWDKVISGTDISQKRFSSSLTGTEAGLLIWSGNWPDTHIDQSKLAEIEAVTPVRVPFELNRQTLLRLSGIEKLRKKYKLRIDQLCALWFSLKHTGRADAKVPFDTVFNSLKKGYDYWAYYADQPVRWDRSGQRDPKMDRLTQSRLMGSLRLSQRDLDVLMDWLIGPVPITGLTSERLNELYRLSHFARILKMNMADFLLLLDVMGKEKVQGIEDFIQISERADWLKLTGLKVFELAYLIYDIPHPKIKVIWADAALRGMADDLLKQAREFLATPQSFMLDGFDLGRAGELTNELKDKGFLTLNLAVWSADGPDLYTVEDKVWDAPALQAVYDAFDWLSGADADPLRMAITEILTQKNATHYSACIEGLAGLFDSDSELVTILFDHYRSHVSPTDFLILMSEVDEDESIPRELTEYLEGYKKVLFIADKFALLPRELGAILDNPEWFGMVDLVSPDISQIDNLFNFKALTTRYKDQEDRLIEIMAASPADAPEKASLLAELADLADWDANRLDRLVVALGFEDSFHTIEHLHILDRCFMLAEELQSDVDFLISMADTRHLNYAYYRNHADTLLQLFQAQYETDKAWEKVYRPVRDKLAERKRDALTSLAMMQIPKSYAGRRSPDLLTEFMLIDVQMGSETDTSRIKQAILSAQLYVQRCLMNLEAFISPEMIPSAQWAWMKNYRVWEANRKVFLYPENYIEPELRDTKSPIFQDLEDELMQSEINEINVTKALSNYLNSFINLSNLKIVGSYLHTPPSGQETLYLISRTKIDPHIYYYRKKENDQKWFPWQKIDLTIDADFVSPVFAFGRLYIFWAELVKGSESRKKGDDSVNVPVFTPTIKYSYLNLANTWVPAQTFAKLDDIDSFETQLLPWQRIYLQQSLEFRSEFTQVAPIVPEKVSVLRLGADSHFNPIQSVATLGDGFGLGSFWAFDDGSFSVSCWLRWNKPPKSDEMAKAEEAKWAAEDEVDRLTDLEAKAKKTADNAKNDLDKIQAELSGKNKELQAALSEKKKDDEITKLKGEISDLEEQKANADSRSETTKAAYEAEKEKREDAESELTIKNKVIDDLEIREGNILKSQVIFQFGGGEMQLRNPKDLTFHTNKEDFATGIELKDGVWSHFHFNFSFQTNKYVVEILKDAVSIKSVNVNSATRLAISDLGVDIGPESLFENNPTWFEGQMTEFVVWPMVKQASEVSTEKNIRRSTAQQGALYAYASLTLQDKKPGDNEWYDEIESTDLPLANAQISRYEVAERERILVFYGNQVLSLRNNLKENSFKLIPVPPQSFSFNLNIYQGTLYLEKKPQAGLFSYLTTLNQGYIDLVKKVAGHMNVGRNLISLNDSSRNSLSKETLEEFKNWTTNQGPFELWLGDEVPTILNNFRIGRNAAAKLKRLEDQLVGKKLELLNEQISLDISEPQLDQLLPALSTIFSYLVQGLRYRIQQTKDRIKVLNSQISSLETQVASAQIEVNNTSGKKIHKDWTEEELELLDKMEILLTSPLYRNLWNIPDALLSNFPIAETRISEVTNQPDWNILDTSDEQFLLRKKVSSHSMDKRLSFDYANGNQIIQELTISLKEKDDLTTPVTFSLERVNTNIIHELSARLFLDGIDGLLSIESQQLRELDFGRFAPNKQLLPDEVSVELGFEGATGLYFREVFFHIPFYIANQLNSNQKFEEAQKWYHYIFNPTSKESAHDKAHQKDRYWRYLPFRNQAVLDFKAILTNTDALFEYHNDPFDPHAIARLRINAYQKAVVMKYIDNLLDWGDSLFRQDTRESINEATLLYILAYNILGPRPKPLVQEKSVVTGTYATIREERQSSIPEFLTLETTQGGGGNSPNHHIEYNFCIPENENFVAYWGRVEDRLFKVRHSLNIDGVFRKLALFEPPIDPMALVRAAAGGRDLGSVLSGMNAPVPHYRYSYLLDKARNLVGTVKGLGDSLLSALEKKDAEALAILQNTQERAILDLITSIKENERDVARANLEGLKISLAGTQEDIDYYEGLLEEGFTDLEELSIDFEITGQALKAVGAVSNTVASILAVVPEVSIGGAGIASPVTITTIGGSKFADGASKFGAVMNTAGEISSSVASVIGTYAEFERKKQDWEFQLAGKNTVFDNLEKQIEAAEISLQSAEQEIIIHQRNLENNKQIQDFMKSKFTNQSLYNWMVSRISGLYFQTYKIAFDMAKLAEKAMQYEFGVNDTFINFGHWDSLKKGLLAGDSLELDLNRLEKAVIDMDSRYLEIEKVISLRQLSPTALFELKNTGKCTFKFTEKDFDYDYPGHYFRVIKALSITIPAVVGPYQTVKATLTQLNSKTLLSPDADALPYLLEESPDATSSVRTNWRAYQSIAISKGVNDSGLFELNFNDDRYLPFEGTGAISEWELSMPKATNHFDFDTLTDVIINLKYTAAQDRGLKKAVEGLLEEYSGQTVFSLAQENPAAWNQFIHSPEKLIFPLPYRAFPHNLNDVAINSVGWLAEGNGVENLTFEVEENNGALTVTPSEGNLDGRLENLILIVDYTGTLPWNTD